VLRIRGRAFELTLRRDTGAILSLVDPRKGTPISAGSRHGVLWGALFDDGTYLGSTYDGASGAHRPFRVIPRWDAESQSLTIDYLWKGPERKLDAQVTLKPVDGHTFDLSIVIDNHTGKTLRRVLLPSDLMFYQASSGSSGAVRRGYGSFIMPGSQFAAADFENIHVQAETGSVHAPDHFLHLELGGSQLAVYPVTGRDDPPLQSAFGLHANDEPGQPPGTFFMVNQLKTLAGSGRYQSPTMRIRVGQEVTRTVLHSRVDKGVGAYPNLADKVGRALPLFKQATMVKIWGNFRDLAARLDQFPAPTLFHFVGITPGGHDRYYPMLVLDPNLGTWDDLRAFVDAAHARGHLVSTYTNKMWWSEPGPGFDSPHPGSTNHDLAVHTAEGSSLRASYSGVQGRFVSQQTPYAQEVTRKMMDRLRAAGIDMVFGDQEGAHPIDEDWNPAEPHPLAFHGGYVGSAEVYRDMAPSTEFGSLRLARSMAAFYGSRGWFDWDGPQNPGRAWPYAQMLLGGKVLLSNHNLADPTFATSPRQLTRNLAMGLGSLLHYEWVLDPANRTWRDVVFAMQQAVSARTVGQRMSSFEEPRPGLSRSTFGKIEVFANLTEAASSLQEFRATDCRVAANAFLARSRDGDLVAGGFEGRFNGGVLSPGVHYLIVERGARSTRIRQPLGDATALRVPAPAQARPGDELRLIALDETGGALGETQVRFEGAPVELRLEPQVGGQRVGSYVVVPRDGSSQDPIGRHPAGIVDEAIARRVRQEGGTPFDGGSGAAVHRWGAGWVQDVQGPSGPGAVMRADWQERALYVGGTAWAHYQSIGGADSFLGYPVGDAEGRLQRFLGGHLRWDEQGRVEAVRGAPERRFWKGAGAVNDGSFDRAIARAARRWGRGRLGEPVIYEGGSVMVRRWGKAWVQDFDHGSFGPAMLIRGDGQRRAYLVRGPIRERYLAAGGATSSLGVPTGDQTVRGGRLSQPFSGGTIAIDGPR
jgi:hypothetical protein